MACLIKDYSSDMDSARLVHTFWSLACALDVVVWFEFVYSEANIADWPSRGELGFVAELGAEEVRRLVVPPTEGWGDIEGALALSSADAEPRKARKRRRRS